MRSPLFSICLLLIIAFRADAVVVHHGDYNNDWWKDGAKAPWSFGVLDEDGDGKVSSAELAKAQDGFLKALKETRSSLVAAADRDESGKLSRHEAQSTKTRWVSLLDRAKEMALAIHDADHDGILSETERKPLRDALTQVFIKYNTVRVDRDKNYRLDPAEVEKAISGILAGKGELFTLCDRNNDGQVSPQETYLALDLLAVTAGLQPQF